MKQQVELGKTQSGQHGLFTGGFLAWPLTPEQHAAFTADRVALRAFVDRLGFELEPTEEERRKAYEKRRAAIYAYGVTMRAI